MAFRNPTVNLLNGRKAYCWFCKKALVLQDAEFEMKQIRGDKPIFIKEQLYFCQSCHRYYITKQMSHDLIQKHPGYYIDVSLYDIKPKRKAIKQKTSNDNGKQKSVTRSPVHTAHIKQSISQAPPASAASINSGSLTNSRNSSALATKIYFSNTFAADHNICPFCNSILRKEAVNIPTINADGDFFRYYVETASYCCKCQRAFLTQKEADRLLRKINSTVDSKAVKTVKFENVSVQRGQSNREYLYRPTLDNTYALYVPGYDYQKDHPKFSCTMDLNSQSFLGKLGYSVNKAVSVRHQILTEAIRIYGKRKVTDHLAFLIATRKGQENGALKYAYAINIWQTDINFLSDL